MFSKYNKLIAALVGNVVAIGLAFAATRAPGIAQCVPVTEAIDPNGVFEQVCSVAGFSQAQITGGLMFVINSAFVYFFPPNRPS